jgi:hypothetical protein
MGDELEARGWNAIDAALRPLYGDQKPAHWAAVVPAMLGGQDPLQGISAYRSTFGGAPHWHFVTYGFSELYEKESDDPETSGYGLELTCRVVDTEEGAEPPKWVWSLLQNLARYVFRTGNVFEPNHSTTLNGPIRRRSPRFSRSGVTTRSPPVQESFAWCRRRSGTEIERRSSAWSVRD